MKKNVMMRVASVMMVLVLMTSSVISGTFAKYVTSHEGSDNARVAKWGVNVFVDGSLFNNSYKNEKTDYTANEETDTITVQAYQSADKVVAPGTNNGNGMVFTLTGTPEVDTQIVFDVTTDTDVVLPKHDGYLNYTTGLATDTFNLAADYYPIVYTLKNGAGAELAKGNLNTIKTYLEGLSGVYHTNKNLAQIGTNTDGTYQLTWAWAFEGAQELNGTTFDAITVDCADTYLGNMAAGTAADVPAGANINVAFAITITATQID